MVKEHRYLIFAPAITELSYPTTRSKPDQPLWPPPGSLTSDSLRRLLNDRLKKGEFMKSIVMPNPVQLSEEIKKQLLHEVKETLATDISVKKQKRYTPAELWNLKRKSRTARDIMRRN